MVKPIAERVDDFRGAWRSPSRDVAEPIAARKCKKQFINLIFNDIDKRTLQYFAELCRTLHFVEVPKINVVNLHQKQDGDGHPDLKSLPGLAM